MQRRAWGAGKLGTEMRKRNSTDQKNRITLIASFDSHCIFTEQTPPAELSAEGRSCITAKQCPFFLLDVDEKTTWTDVRKNCLPEEHPGGFARDDPGHGMRHATMYLKQLSSYGCLSWEASLETKANQPDGVTVSTTVVFVTDSGGDEDKMIYIARDASTPTLFFWWCALPSLLHLYHCIVKRSDIRRQFVRDRYTPRRTLG